MSRILLSIEELNHLIREEMRKHTECARVPMRSVYRQERDSTGCNWDVSMGESDPADMAACRERIIATIRELRKQYNIVEES